ncbi:hypothetical protein CEXT_397481 [Caerostris extrusa]|uniref:Uncharacterized protein n=1 Tax=Caerostris extrusa TaxID=172846 RepID=A0AAV4Q4J5_CAEEX|nr:hypothetical protein CEXT_397481 [Caerostris extrusa]
MLISRPRLGVCGKGEGRGLHTIKCDQRKAVTKIIDITRRSLGPVYCTHSRIKRKEPNQQPQPSARKHIIQVSTYQMCVHVIFNTPERLTYEVRLKRADAALNLPPFPNMPSRNPNLRRRLRYFSTLPFARGPETIKSSRRFPDR